uniref:Elongation of very long chain fatty acids protein n=1 Tax=Myxobolus squamalis TaxID=59785 RepID=A0A6B2FYT7_MYXSQ
MLSQLTEWYENLCNSGEPMVKDWALVRNPIPIAIISFTYLSFIIFGKAFMKNRAPYKLQTFMVIYNCIIVLLSAHIAIGSMRALFSIPNVISELHRTPQNLHEGPGYQAIQICNKYRWYGFIIYIFFRKLPNSLILLYLYFEKNLIKFRCFMFITTSRFSY